MGRVCDQNAALTTGDGLKKIPHLSSSSNHTGLSDWSITLKEASSHFNVTIFHTFSFCSSDTQTSPPPHVMKGMLRP